MGRGDGVGSVPEELNDTDGSNQERVPGAIKVGEETFTTVEDLTEAYRNAKAHRDALTKVVGRQGQELGNHRGGNGNDSSSEDDLGIPKQVFDEFENKFVENPGNAMKSLVKNVIETTEKRVENRLRQEWRTENVVEAFWSDYFDEHPKHREIEEFVRMTGDRMARTGALQGMVRDDQMVAVATAINRTGTSVFGSAKVRDVPNSRVVSEAGKGGGATRKPAGDANATSNTSDKSKSFMDEVRSQSYRKGLDL